MNKELWNKAVAFHGHQCVGLALGFRMGEEAKKIFGANAEIHCKIPSKTCITDGITVTTGASLENGRIQIDNKRKQHIFYVLDDEEGWAISKREMEFPGGQDPVAATLACNRDFLFMLEPVDMDGM